MITILGVGNLLMRDEGFGPQFISHLPEAIKFIGIIPDVVELGMELSPILQNKIEPVAQLVIQQIEEWTHARVVPGPGLVAPTS